ncbi:MAG TPA: TetR/AcrR family transcriptional regulator [Pelagibacterium sp.]|uniref:TetR/AcrR family transcriptional regulator n=1 Tax=Pelagibacterium sp. TaxID=1967288 RepID=UPI002C05FB29|nr:TetR/AcrR family transcriptional regulator [Pelagibacterium sp.]HWJ86618.1 TetR/AcrR family transcriptional regulator [Pelagibacterium sp.]
MRHAQRRRATREALIDSATAEIAESGISGASLRRITKRAGYTQGAFYSNFSTANDLFEAVLEQRMSSRMGKMEAILTSDGSLESVVERLEDWLKSMQQDKAGMLVMLEFQLHALRDPEFGGTYNRMRAAQHDLISRAIDTLRAERGIELKLPSTMMALGFSALWSGFAMQGDGAGDGDTDTLIGAFIRALI